MAGFADASSDIGRNSQEHGTTAAPSSTHSVHPDHVTKRVQQCSPDAGLCAITLVAQPVQLCRLLSENTNTKDVTQLEFAWGLEAGTLDPNSARNIIVLATDLFTTFTQGDWALVPPMETIEEVMWQTVDDDISNTRELDSRKMYEYKFVHFKGPAVDIIRQNSETGRPDIFSAPYSNLPAIRSHIHPCFVICDLALKDIRHHYPDLEGELLHCVARCRGLYKGWMSAKPWVMPHLPPPINSSTTLSSPSLSRSNLSSVSAIVYPPKLDVALKRKHEYEDLTSDLEGLPDTKLQREITAESLENLGSTQWGIKGWIKDVESCSSLHCPSKDGTDQLAVAEDKSEDVLSQSEQANR